jgi:glucuronate isomerase
MSCKEYTQMRTFMDDDFLLHTDTARVLYHEYAAKMPIYDYHCHIDVQEIAEDHSYENITQVWLYGDHYKWRAMRLFGIDERLITGDASDYEKFEAYARMMPYLIGNPLYHWSHLELKNYFGIDTPLSAQSAAEIWQRTSRVLQDGLSVRKMISTSQVTALCSTDDPLDTLEYHRQIAEDPSVDCMVLPTFRPDKGVQITRAGFRSWVERLGAITGREVTDYDGYLDALEMRIDYFASHGCVIADHGLDQMVFCVTEREAAQQVFAQVMKGEQIGASEETAFMSHTLSFLASCYCQRDWTMQLHMSAMRANNTLMHERLGPDTGFDSIGDQSLAAAVSGFLDHVHTTGLPKTILYSLNPKDLDTLGSMMGDFPGGSYGTRVQLGCAWWFNDHIDGMTAQLRSFANLGVLPRFVGMLTDSRSFLSYARHEYFRRILCSILGEFVERGEYPEDLPFLGSMVQDISYRNAVKFISSPQNRP